MFINPGLSSERRRSRPKLRIEINYFEHEFTATNYKFSSWRLSNFKQTKHSFECDSGYTEKQSWMLMTLNSDSEISCDVCEHSLNFNRERDKNRKLAERLEFKAEHPMMHLCNKLTDFQWFVGSNWFIRLRVCRSCFISSKHRFPKMKNLINLQNHSTTQSRNSRFLSY